MTRDIRAHLRSMLQVVSWLGLALLLLEQTQSLLLMMEVMMELPNEHRHLEKHPD